MELILAIVIFIIAIIFTIYYFVTYQKNQLEQSDSIGFFNNKYIFETLPSAFPTLGIFCTALGITLGIWNFDTNNIEASMPALLEGLKLAFIATMFGIVGLLVFQKWAGVISNKIENNPDLPKKDSSELGALNTLITKIDELKNINDEKLSLVINSLEKSNLNFVTEMSVLFKSIGSDLNLNISSINSTLQKQEESSKVLLNGIDNSLKKLQTENSEFNNQSIKNSQSIIDAMSKNNSYIIEKFENFSDLLAKNNTEALVDVMKNVTETFNSQMSELIEKLVKENFDELNQSVQNMNVWQQENKSQIITLTDSYKSLTDNFKDTSDTLVKVTDNVTNLVGENSKLVKLVDTLNTVLIEENNFTEISSKLSNTVDILQANTEAFDETTNKLNEWVRTERNFKDSADILIIKLEQFRDFNSDVWSQYRKEMDSAVGIIEKTSLTISEQLTDIDEEFYERLSSTLENLDNCIQRAMLKYE